MNTWIEYCIALSTLKHCDLMAKYLEFKKKKKNMFGQKNQNKFRFRSKLGSLCISLHYNVLLRS